MIIISVLCPIGATHISLNKSRDGVDGQIYTVKQELTHGPVHSMKRYMVEKKGESNPK